MGKEKGRKEKEKEKGKKKKGISSIIDRICLTIGLRRTIGLRPTGRLTQNVNPDIELISPTI